LIKWVGQGPVVAQKRIIEHQKQMSAIGTKAGITLAGWNVRFRG
jgi:hypothetical protein